MGRHPAVGVQCKEVAEGLLITGGFSSYSTRHQAMEAFNPYISKICNLPNMPENRAFHTFCGGLVCGGRFSSRSCLKFGPLGFLRANASLQQNRLSHLCWNVPEGVLLLGGKDSPSTTELVLRDGSASVSKFKLSYPVQ